MNRLLYLVAVLYVSGVVFLLGFMSGWFVGVEQGIEFTVDQLSGMTHNEEEKEWI